MSHEEISPSDWYTLLRSDDRAQRMEALTSVGRRGARWRSHERACETIGLERTGGAFSSEVRDAVLEALEDEDPKVRAEAALALAAWDDGVVAEALKERLTDPDERVRCAVIQSFGILTTAQATEELLEIAEMDPSPGVRAHALAAMAAVEGHPERETGDRGTPSAIRVGGGPSLGPRRVRDRLNAIEKGDASSYVRFLARRARREMKLEYREDA